MRETIRKLGQTKTILLPTRILQEVEAMASRMMLIDEGRLKSDGTIAELIKDGRPFDVRFRGLSERGLTPPPPPPPPPTRHKSSPANRQLHSVIAMNPAC